MSINKTIEKCTKIYILYYSYKSDFIIPKNCRGIPLTVIDAKVYNVLLLNCTKPEINKLTGTDNSLNHQRTHKRSRGNIMAGKFFQNN